jgi:hypothetical protein
MVTGIFFQRRISGLFPLIDAALGIIESRLRHVNDFSGKFILYRVY